VKTRSEEMFERFCNENSLPFTRVETEHDNKTPDYELILEGHRVFAEVKELRANHHDNAASREADSHGAAAAFADPRKRIRKQIGEAGRQLKQRSKGLHPAILVLFDNGTFGGIDTTDIKNAMYGDEEVRVTRPSSEDMSVVFRLGGGRKCTATDNKSLSAVALPMTTSGTIRLSIFHNGFAAQPLPFDCFTVAACRQYSIDLQCQNEFPEWHAIGVDSGTA
jgi:hypothetical protein